MGAINGPDKSGKVRTDEVSPPCPRAAQRMTAGSAADWHSAYGSAGLSQNRFATDSPLEGDGFELPVPRAMQARLEAKIAGFGCMFAIDYLRLPSVAIS